MLKKIELYTNGACSCDTKKGGWACIFVYNGIKKELIGNENHTTNSRMELTAIIKGLEHLKEKCEVVVYTDAQFIFLAFNNGRIKKMESQGWKTKKGKPIRNADLWKILISLTKNHIVTFCKVKAHSNNENNNYCDHLAKCAKYF